MERISLRPDGQRKRFSPCRRPLSLVGARKSQRAADSVSDLYGAPDRSRLAPMTLAIEHTLIRSPAAASLRSIRFQEGSEFLDGTQDARTAGWGRRNAIGVFRVGISNTGCNMRESVDLGSYNLIIQSQLTDLGG